MDQNVTEQGWQQLQANIERFLGQSLQSDGRGIEYKPRFIKSSPEPVADYAQQDEVVHHFRR
ncbi:MAG: hypothetical protein LLG97_01345 [Deltaproteobacteria bacterium]|nr:hypothetical protein [Deltaproteobacteria bacterium]